MSFTLRGAHWPGVSMHKGGPEATLTGKNAIGPSGKNRCQPVFIPSPGVIGSTASVATTPCRSYAQPNVSILE